MQDTLLRLKKMPLLRSSSRGGSPREVALSVKVMQREGEMAIPQPRKGVAFKPARAAAPAAAAEPPAAATGGAIRSASKRVARQASKSPYARPGTANIPAPPVSSGLSSAMDQLMLGQPVSARTRLRTQAAFLRRPEQAALASSLGGPGALGPRTAALMRKHADAQAAKAATTRRLAPHEVALSGAALLGASSGLGPREARAEERKKRAAARLGTQPGHTLLGAAKHYKPAAAGASSSLAATAMAPGAYQVEYPGVGTIRCG